MSYLESEDGITHINIYSKGKTSVGRFMSNFTKSHVQTEDGSFASVEGYWYWLGCKNDRLRTAYGYGAKKLGRELGAPDWLDGDEFRRKILVAIKSKIKMLTNSDLQQLLLLPLTHYYIHNGRVIDMGPRCQWILDGIISMAKEQQELRAIIE